MGQVVIPDTWIVTTEGDCEGKSPDKRLGIYSGSIDRIAFGLMDKAEYTLQFEPVAATPAEDLPVRRTTAYVRLPYDVDDPMPFFKDRPVSLSKGQYYRSWELRAGGAYRAIVQESLANEAACKLSQEEFAALRKKILAEG